MSDASLFRLSACRNLCKVDLNANKACNETITSAGKALKIVFGNMPSKMVNSMVVLCKRGFKDLWF